MKKLLFVCMGNICRSPAAEGIMRSILFKGEMSSYFECDSAGTIGSHAGEPTDIRMQHQASLRDYELNGLARKFLVKDFEEFDYILTMDDQNFKNVLGLDKKEQFGEKVSKMTSYCTKFTQYGNGVPDPYYGGVEGFELVLDILEDACMGFFKQLKEEYA